MATKFRKIERNGKKRTVPMNEGRKATRERTLSAREVEDLTGVGIKHPGTLRKHGYFMSSPDAVRHPALDSAVKEYGKKGVLSKLGEIYRLNFTRPQLRDIAANDIKYVSGGKKND
ncbi:MAG: hypothetical protein ACYCUZ_05430 [Cuniculiplasma sp.]